KAMSKVLVDRELLERIAHDDEGAASLADFEELKRFLTQPAEAEGVEVVGFLYKNNGGALTAADMDSDTFALMARSDFDGEVEKLVRQVDHLAALSAVTAERDRLLEANEILESQERYREQERLAAIEEADKLRAEVDGLRSDASPDGFVSAPLEPSLSMQNAGWHEIASQGIDPETVE